VALWGEWRVRLSLERYTFFQILIVCFLSFIIHLMLLWMMKEFGMSMKYYIESMMTKLGNIWLVIQTEQNSK